MQRSLKKLCKTAIHNAMKISIMTATYNSEATIRDTLESVNAQTYPHIEHIIVDGASKDNTLDLVKKYGKECL
jgi:glycosyltransferase involved in cell wall biosynthesis